MVLGKKNESSLNIADIKELLLIEFEKYSLKESVANISVKTGINRSKVYKAALGLIKDPEIT
jgi:hypothetical protein